MPAVEFDSNQWDTFRRSVKPIFSQRIRIVMNRFLFLILLLATPTASAQSNEDTSEEDRIWPSVRMICKGDLAIDEREHIIFINPRTNRLRISERTSSMNINRLTTQELRTTENSYYFKESGQQIQQNSFEIDRNSLKFSLSYRYGATSFYRTTGECEVSDTKI